MGMWGRRRDDLMVPALMAAALSAALAQTIVLAALPAFGREFGVSPAAATWALTAFMLASAVTTPIAGRLGDMFGHRRALLACLALFAAGSLVCALAGSLGWLVAGRALQGTAGGVFPLAFGIVRTSAAPAHVPKLAALLSGMFGIGGSLGMVVSGPLVDAFGTSSLFWLTLGLGLVSLALAPSVPAAHDLRPGRVDLAGAALLSGALICLLLAISQARTWGWAWALALAASAVALLAAFALTERRVRDPLVDLALVVRPPLGTTNLFTGLIAVALFGGTTMVPRLVQAPHLGGSATDAGLVMLPVAVLTLAVSPLAPRLGARFSLAAGGVLAAVAFLFLAVAHGHMAELYAAGVFIGAGYGLAFAAIGTLVVGAVAPHQTGAASGVNTIVRTVTAAAGAQAAAPMAFTGGFVAFAAIALLGLAVALVALPRAGRRDTAAERDAPTARKAAPYRR
ncbi:MFS transporter [Actinomadura barringtoniae]|uniref:MFS transporter n=1 Tax=Actinomadura barringtoniae TaxID=1427535 RepID=A0A939PBP0_9ACTN|nr:MFS transporter [Actinomadura barringtoniae]MBO2445516.1 MFS transporter [Actinomadura barringtoniae]